MRIAASRRRAASGFTLLEAVVALAILAMTSTAVYQSFGWTLRRGVEQRWRDLAWLTAQSLLDDVRARRSAIARREHGETALGLEWTTAVEPYPFATNGSAWSVSSPDAFPWPGTSPEGGQELTAVQVTIAVSWGHRPGQRVELRSVEIAAP